MSGVPLAAYLAVGAVLFAIGLYAMIAQRSAVMVLMGVELVLNAVGLNLVAFWRFVRPSDYSGQIFAILVVTIGAIEMAIGLGVMLLVFRARRSVQVDAFERLRG
jgi:NADH-quinone oxidoreductase subunit K/NAD(P)H-quinone oxidoreductase subunit 4L